MEAFNACDVYMDRRKYYAEEIAAIGGVRSQSLLKAFCAVPRERYLPPGPWVVENIDGVYYPTQDASISHVLHAVGVCLDVKRGLNTANPARIGRFLEAVGISEGETVFHVGAGLGYFTAIMSELVGETGRVIAAEIDPKLRKQACQNLAHRKNVDVVDDAREVRLPAVDVIFSSAGMSTIPRHWSHSVRDGGRMLLPLTGMLDSGHVFLFDKADDASFHARRYSFMRFYPCLGGRDSAGMRALDNALSDSRIDTAQKIRLRFDPHERGDLCWAHGDEYCISLEI